MARTFIRLSIKVSTFAMLTVVASTLLTFYIAGGGRLEDAPRWIFLFAVMTLFGTLLFTLFLDSIITVPLQALVKYTQQMVSEDFKSPPPAMARDEIGQLARAIDRLRINVVTQRQSLQELNEQLDANVAARTAELQQALAHLEATQAELLQVEKLASIGRLAGGVAHEINNPAGIILTRTGLMLEAAQEDGLSPDVVESLQVIDRQVRRIARITQDLLTFSRSAPMHRVRVDFTDLANWSWSAYRHQAQALNIRLEGDLPPGLMVLAEASALEQVLGNLIKNAIDAMETSGGVLTRAVQLQPELLVFTLADTGPGIPEEVMPRLFDPFFTTKQVGKGTGLGLAISYGIVRDLGGGLEAANRPGGGAVFTLTLPLAGERSLSTGEWVFDPGDDKEQL